MAFAGAGLRRQPVVSYYDSTGEDLKVLHCNDPDCSGGNESITSPDTGAWVGLYTSLQLDGSGYPVVSYRNAVPDPDLKVLHCNDPNCTGADDSITSPDTGGTVGSWSSLALDASGHPVVSYFDGTNGHLKVLHCNDPDCAGDDESVTSPDTGTNVGQCTSLVLDSAGSPVVSYFDGTNSDLKVLHCNDPDCTGADESITSPDTYVNGGQSTSLALDGSGYPVVSYSDNTNNDLKVLHCNDPDCTGGDESITSPDTDAHISLTFGLTSLELDASGYPVVSYHDQAGWDLKLLHCADVNCAVKSTPTPTSTVTNTPTPTKQPAPGDTDGDGCPDADENGPDEFLGGRRDYRNPWDYFNPTNDGLNRIDDVLAVVDHYFLREGEPGYDGGKYDRSYVGPNDWNLGPPDGQVLVDDVLHAVKSYFHDCGEGVVKPTPTATPAP